MVVASAGRLAFVTLLICLLVRWILDWKRPSQIGLAWAGLALLVLGLMASPGSQARVD